MQDTKKTYGIKILDRQVSKKEWVTAAKNDKTNLKLK